MHPLWSESSSRILNFTRIRYRRENSVTLREGAQEDGKVWLSANEKFLIEVVQGITQGAQVLHHNFFFLGVSNGRDIGGQSCQKKAVSAESY